MDVAYRLLQGWSHQCRLRVLSSVLQLSWSLTCLTWSRPCKVTPTNNLNSCNANSRAYFKAFTSVTRHYTLASHLTLLNCFDATNPYELCDLPLLFCSLLSVPRCNLEFGSRAFRISAPKIWNSLSANIRDSPSLPTSRRQLKTHYFQLAYLSPWWPPLLSALWFFRDYGTL